MLSSAFTSWDHCENVWVREHSTAMFCIVNISLIWLLVLLLRFIFFSLSIKVSFLEAGQVAAPHYDSCDTRLSCAAWTTLPYLPHEVFLCLWCFLFNIHFGITKELPKKWLKAIVITIFSANVQTLSVPFEWNVLLIFDPLDTYYIHVSACSIYNVCSEYNIYVTITGLYEGVDTMI